MSATSTPPPPAPLRLDDTRLSITPNCLTACTVSNCAPSVDSHLHRPAGTRAVLLILQSRSAVVFTARGEQQLRKRKKEKKKKEREGKKKEQMGTEHPRALPPH